LFTLVYWLDGKRKREVFPTKEKAVAAAKSANTELSKGDLGAVDLTVSLYGWPAPERWTWYVAGRILVRGLTARSTRNENPRLSDRARVPLSFLPRDAAGIAGAADGRIIGDGAFAI
jgi:hypothetical protein